MKFYWKYFLLGLVIVLAINYKTFFGDNSTNQASGNQEVVHIVKKGTIKESIEIVGSAELVDEQSLGFNIAGTVTAVYVKAGDSVKRGDVIAEIDNADALNSIENAQIGLENARISLTQLYEKPDESTIMQSKNSITNAENALAISEKELENLKVSQENTKNKQLDDIENQKKELESMKKSLELSKNELEILKREQTQNLDNTVSNKSTTIKTTEDSFKTYLIEIEKIATEADYIMGVTKANESLNDSYEMYLGAKNSTYKNLAHSLLYSLIANIDTQKSLVNSYSYNGNKAEIIEILESFSDLYDQTYEMADAVYKTAENSVESSSVLTSSTIESMKTTFSGYRNTALNKITSIKSTINTLNTLSDTDLISTSNQNTIASKEESIKSQELSIEKQEINILNAEKTYKETLASQKVALTNAENDVNSKTKSLEVAKKSYDELLQGPTAENVKKANNSILQAQLSLNNATKNLDDYQLTAPFDGIVRKIDYMVGDNLKNDNDKYVYLENPDLIEIIVKLDQIDIINVKLGDDAIITFDSYTNFPAKAKVTLIDTTPITTSGVVSYEVKLVLNDEDFDKTILSGMTANVEIITDQKEDVLILKSSAIKNKEGKKVVTLERNGVREEVEIETGMTANGETEVISGLNEGDKVIAETIVVPVSTGNSSFQMGGPGGGGGNTMMMRP